MARRLWTATALIVASGFFLNLKEKPKIETLLGAPSSRPDKAFAAQLASCSASEVQGIQGITPQHVARRVVSSLHEREFKGAKTFTFREVGHALLAASEQQNTTLLTVQVGGMDGQSNDPMYNMMMSTKISLRHWLPLVVEPVAVNFANLVTTYDALKREKEVSCQFLEQRAISYNGQRECTFCHFNTSDNAPETCKNHPDWMKFQIGTLQCDRSQIFFGVNFEQCIVQAKVDCGPITDALKARDLPSDAVSILQLDVEGYEDIILQGMLLEFPVESYPAVIHFEQKVLQSRDQQDHTNKTASLTGLLRAHGYVLYDRGEDMLALLV